MTSDMMKGGLRYKRLKKLVAAKLADEGPAAWFIGTTKEVDLARVTFRTGSGLMTLAADEYVLAVTGRAVHIIEMGGLGIVSAKLQATVAEIPIADATAELVDGKVLVDGLPFHVFPYHDEDAQAFVTIVSGG